MDHRVGLCSACGASFKVPASFSADRAKCKACGGVVEIGPVISAAGPGAGTAAGRPVPARKPTPRAAGQAPRPEQKKAREGPSMKERLLAQRTAEAGTTPSAVPAGKASQGRPAATGRQAQVVAGPKARAVADVPTGKVAPGAKKPVAGAGARTSASGAGGSRATRGAGAERGAAASRRAGAAGRRRGGRDDDGEGTSEGGGRRGRAAPARPRGREKQNPAVLLIALLLVVVAAGAGAWFLFTTGDGDGAASQPEQAAAPAVPGEGGTTDEGAADMRADLGGGDPGLRDGVAAAGAPPAADEAADEGADGAGGAAGEDSAARPARRSGDPDSIDLRALEPFGPAEGIDEAEWLRIRNLVATALDADSGIAGSRARQELEAMGKPAVPALINAMARLDYSTEQGYQDGDLAQRMLRIIANGMNFGWRYTTEPGDEYYNKRVVENWAQVWRRAKDDHAYWLEWTKQETADDPAEGADEGIKIRDDDLDALDDI